MADRNARRLSTVAKGVAAALSAHPEGLDFHSLMAITPPVSANVRHSRAERDLRRAAIPMIRAGWIEINRGRWMLSEDGRRANARHTDSDEFLQAAARQSLRGWLAVRVALYIYGVQSFERLSVELRAIRRIGLRHFLGTTLKTEKWQDILPIQAPKRCFFPQIEFGTIEELTERLGLDDIPYSQGGHAIYLPPASVRQSPFRELAKLYPADAGLKIIKNEGGVANSRYALGPSAGDSRVHTRLIHRPQHLSIVACLFFNEGVGPRLYDFIELLFGGRRWTAYIIQHVAGRAPTTPECREGIGKLREMERRGIMKVLLPEGFGDPEFECPSCSDNALVSKAGSFRYVDFQNFLLTNYEAYLTKVTREAAEASHFGDRNILRGGRYLYQSVPGVRLPGKRNIEERTAVIAKLISESNVSIKNRLVLDVGCNIGMMMAQYLKMGAAWCHGWDRGHITPHTERILSALGCTRFSTTGGEISSDQPLDMDLPEFIKPALDGCVVSYLAVRGHLGWLQALVRIPWKIVIYEGHEGEDESDFEQHVSELNEIVGCSVVGIRYSEDGDGERRPISILKRYDSRPGAGVQSMVFI